MIVGDVYRHERFYPDATSGQLMPKYLVVLALPAGGDIVARVLTTRWPEHRPEVPPCFHGDPSSWAI